MKAHINNWFSPLPQFALISILFWLSLPAAAAETASNHSSYIDHFYIQVGTYTHYRSDSEHTGLDIFGSVEAVRADSWLYGLALFNNSFGQFSQYLYTGKSWNFNDAFDNFHVKLTGGLIHGYRGHYRDKIPFNRFGIAPAIIPGVGYANDKYGADIVMLGTSGLLFTVGMKL